MNSLKKYVIHRDGFYVLLSFPSVWNTVTDRQEIPWEIRLWPARSIQPFNTVIRRTLLILPMIMSGVRRTMYSTNLR
jgi:hypothetical protein